MLANYHNVFDWRGKPLLITVCTDVACCWFTARETVFNWRLDFKFSFILSLWQRCL